MPDDIQGTQNPPLEEDYLEKLLAGTAKKETERQMKEALAKGVITRDQFNAAMAQFEINIVEKVTSAVAEQVKKAVPPAPAEPNEPPENQGGEGQAMQKGQRKGTIPGASDPRADNPIRYLIQKGRAGEAFDDLDRALIWGLTEKGFTQGMSYQDIDGPDFGDDSAY